MDEVIIRSSIRSVEQFRGNKALTSHQIQVPSVLRNSSPMVHEGPEVIAAVAIEEESGSKRQNIGQRRHLLVQVYLRIFRDQLASHQNF